MSHAQRALAAWDALDSKSTPVDRDKAIDGMAAVLRRQVLRPSADPLRARLYRHSARRILATLCAPPFLIDADDGHEGILRCAMYHERRGLGVNQSVMWGDHFFLEALCNFLHE